MFHVLSAIAEFERDLIRERVIAGMRRARAQGRRVGRPRKYRVDPTAAQELLTAGTSRAEWHGAWGCTRVPSGALAGARS